MLRAMIGFDHCLKNTPVTWLATSGLPIIQSPNGSPKGIVVDNNSALSVLAGNPGGNQPQSCFDFTALLNSAMTSFTIGYRAIQVTAGNTGPFAYIANDNAGSNYLQLLTFAQLGITAAGTSVYIEHTFDLVGNTVTTFLDGVNIGSAALSGTFLTNVKLGKATMLWNHTAQQTAGVTSVRDIYAVDNIAGDGMVARLGAQTIYPANVDAATGNGWTATDGSTDFAGTLNAAQPATAALSSPVDKTPLVLSAKAFAPVGFKIKAVSMGISGQSRGDTASSSKLEIALNGTTQALGNVNISKAAVYNVPVKILPLAPDGSAWDLTKLDTAVITLTPDV